jgi:hypothetical protein
MSHDTLFFRGRDTGSIFLRSGSQYVIVQGRGIFAGKEGAVLHRRDVMAGNGIEPYASPWAALSAAALPEAKPVAEAADKRIATLEAALKPFAEAADSTDANDDYSSASIWEHPSALDITIGHLRRARTALSSTHSERK